MSGDDLREWADILAGHFDELQYGSGAEGAVPALRGAADVFERNQALLDKLCEKVRELEAALLPFCEFSPDVLARIHAAALLGIEP